MQALDLDAVAKELGWAILKRLAAETELKNLIQLGGEADGQDLQGEGNQGA